MQTAASWPPCPLSSLTPRRGICSGSGIVLTQLTYALARYLFLLINTLMLHHFSYLIASRRHAQKYLGSSEPLMLCSIACRSHAAITSTDNGEHCIWSMLMRY